MKTAICNYFNRIWTAFLDDEVDIGIKNVIISYAFGILCNILFLTVCYISDLSSSMKLVTAMLILALILCMYLCIRTGRFELFTGVFIFIINFIEHPLLVVMTGGMINGGPILFPLGILVIFFLIRSMYSFPVCAAYILMYSYVLIFSDSNMDIILDRTLNENIYGKGIVITFMLVVLASSFLIVYLRTIYEKMHRKTIDSKEKIANARVNKSRFLANMTDEIRTPMNALITSSELILKEKLSPTSKELAETVQKSAAQLLKTINNVLEYSKIDSDRMEIVPVKYNFRKMISEVIIGVGAEYENEGIEFYSSIDPNIPSYLFGDELRIKQVLKYILFSVAQRLPNSRIFMFITCDINTNTNSVLLKYRIAEAGIGLSDSEINGMLSAYTYYDSRRKNAMEGMDLEFPICNELIKLMGGSLDIDSIEGVGMAINIEYINYIIDDRPVISIPRNQEYTILVYAENKSSRENWISILNSINLNCYFVEGPNAFRRTIEDRKYTHIFVDESLYSLVSDTLKSAQCENYTYVICGSKSIFSDFDNCKLLRKPINSLNLSDIIAGKWTQENYSVAEALESLKYPNASVLLVDDSVVNLKVLAGMLSTYLIKPDLAKSGEQALKMLRTKSYDLLIVDQRMPNMDGIELLGHIKKLDNSNCDAPILCATADFGPEVGRGLIEKGFDDYLAKPVRNIYLAKMLRRFLPSGLAQSQGDVKVDAKPGSYSDKKTPGGGEAAREDPRKWDTAIGITNVGNNLEAFGAVLNAYYSEGISKIDEITHQYKGDDYSLYTINVHALKSSSAGIGALGLSAMFKDLEFAGKASDKDFIEGHTLKTLEIFKDVLEKVKEYLTENNLLEKEEVISEISNKSVEELNIDEVNKIKSALAVIDLKTCEKGINILAEKNFGTEVNILIADIKKAYDMFDYHKVKELLEKLSAYDHMQHSGNV